MLDLAQITDDFSRKYSGSYVRWLPENTTKKEVVFITNIFSDDRGSPKIKLVHPNYKEIIINYDSLVQLDFEWPKSGYYNFNGIALLFSRWIARQWKKGICSTNAVNFTPYGEVGSSWFKCNQSFFRKITDLSYANLEALYNNSFPPFFSAVNTLQQSAALSVALSPWIALGLNTGESPHKLLIWFQRTPIGYYHTLDKTINVKVVAFKQEIKDYLNRNAIYNVEVV